MSVRSLPARGEFTAPANCTVAAALRAHLVGQSWSDLRSLCLSGKISVKGESELNPARRLAGGETVAWSLTAPDPRRTASRPEFSIVYEDGHLIVIEKPEGVSSVPTSAKSEARLWISFARPGASKASVPRRRRSTQSIA